MRNLPIILFLFLFCVPMWAATDPEVARYSIPANAIKRGPTRVIFEGGESQQYDYYPAGTDFDSKAFNKERSLIATEIYIRNFNFDSHDKMTLGERTLFKNGRIHGMQRKWNEMGHLEWETPYKDGLLDGTCKIWNWSEQLVSQYEMVAGAGTVRRYFDNGCLEDETHIKNNEADGLSTQWFDNGQLRESSRYAAGRTVGVSLGFYKDGALYSIMWNKEYVTPPKFLKPNDLMGVYIEFTPAGAVKIKAWSLGDEVDEKVYAAAAAKDPTLPPYYADATEYQKLVAPEVRALSAKHRAVPPVKIPLEFDAQGNAVFAPTPK